ncbi:AraC family transcriptional regulator [Terasakiella brassicae]|uniref:AraC family transcriptional regulator n=1 Tax=Terasakiella brassicae TaxID=1634917 RepID=A0A917C1P5_9PROT|nr:helix-turn-helix domain-containing protein [Terasakiella brassicae]GGF66395.1 AraC family transcriptional regulator [Terasakiella brassicae]
MKDAPYKASIAILAYPDVQQAAVLGLADLFEVANRNSATHTGGQLDVRILSTEDLKNREIPFCDTIIFPPSLSQDRRYDDQDILDWVKAGHGQGATICSICAGAFWLGASGLLDGRPVTTHWLLEEDLQRQFPKAEVNSERILIDDHDIVSAGGLMAWVDLGLFVVTRYLGQHITSMTARHLLIDPSGREQKNYRSFRPVLNHGDPSILSVQHGLEKSYADEVSVEGLAGQAHMSSRTFLRRFKAATGLTPTIYLQHLRIEKARGLLERTRLPVGEVAWRVGYKDVSAFSRVFKEITGLKAGRYRERFSINS